MSERLLLRGQDAEGLPVAEVVLPRHELEPRRGAQRLRIAVREPDPGPGEIVEDGRAVRRPAVTAQTLVAQVIGQNQDDVRPPFRRRA